MALQAVKKFRIKELKAISPRNISPSQSTPKPSLPNAVTRSNPFLPHRNPNTGRWIPPKYSLRQQADLVKKAKQTNTLALIPPGPKLSVLEATVARQHSLPVSVRPQPWSKPVEWEGQVKERVVPGADIGNRLYAGKKRMFKGHKWERVLEGKTKRKAMLMRDMGKRITRFKQHYKRRRPHPLKPPRTSKSQKLPF
ncbi:hypothetical protein SERLA73DRAFT_165356 [Serpula lacrymans var. lacrymans S7.3]|uniref:Large ribosomal subunit protein mL59 domain-containing protein n=2 Tax=Serpula lacrymans var. lacrymans TaxID=341189 RepID=F8PJC8_SERL3|nr:uncharacterized protein SERLADRAFT_457612 [Serpula lacrymans var. lacrymans S7.9]EGO03753.1 hypothetical protein SERLA73DRAFT_165356 [Serpula lacrymans var. lacrymans S7.3]EGO29620.1 hypothetical protein SERLADRAFT_457612 [Serpula lacrymans var. lacrymans S7.9]